MTVYNSRLTSVMFMPATEFNVHDSLFPSFRHGFDQNRTGINWTRWIAENEGGLSQTRYCTRPSTPRSGRFVAESDTYRSGFQFEQDSLHKSNSYNGWSTPLGLQNFARTPSLNP